MRGTLTSFPSSSLTQGSAITPARISAWGSRSIRSWSSAARGISAESNTNQKLCDFSTMRKLSSTKKGDTKLRNSLYRSTSG